MVVDVATSVLVLLGDREERGMETRREVGLDVSCWGEVCSEEGEVVLA